MKENGQSSSATEALMEVEEIKENEISSEVSAIEKEIPAKEEIPVKEDILRQAKETHAKLKKPSLPEKETPRKDIWTPAKENEEEVESEFERIKKNAKAVKESLGSEKKAKKSRPSKNLSKFLESKKEESKPKLQERSGGDGSGSLEINVLSDPLQNGDSRNNNSCKGENEPVIPTPTKSIKPQPTPLKSTAEKPTPSRSIQRKLAPSKSIPAKLSGPKQDLEETITIGRC